MSNAMGDFGVDPAQGPPLSVPLGFFFIAPLAMMSAGLLILSHSTTIFAWRNLPWTMALVHIGTLGFLGAVMLGAMYQMLAVVASPVPFVRIAHLVQALLCVGTVSLATAFLFDQSQFSLAWICLAATFVLFFLPVVIALARTKTRTATVYGIMLAVVGLASVVIMGAIMSRARAGAAFTGYWLSWVHAHLTMGAVVWVGGLITAVSFQVVPMFYLTDPYPRWLRRGMLIGITATATGLIAIVASSGSSDQVILAALPGALAVWLVHPLATLVLLRGKRRKRVDLSIRFWQVGLLCGPLVLCFATTTWLSDHPRWPILLGWTIIWGWAGLIIVGMLSRIVPFLVWFHRYSWLVGKTRVPSMKRLWPGRQLPITLISHGLTLLLGIAAIASAWPPAAVATGIGLGLTGALLLLGLVQVALHLRVGSSDGAA